MSTTPELPTHAFPTAASFDTFLAREHASAPGIFLKFAKKASGIPSITAAEAVEVALCYGWIDGRANALDDKWWTVRYTPRRSKSIWSQKNVGTVAKLIEGGRIRPAGLAAVEAAKADGRWDRAYAGPASITTPDDFAIALAAEPTAEGYFESLNKSEKYSMLWQLATVAEKNRQRKIDTLVQTLSVGKVPGASTKKGIVAKQDGKSKVKKTTAMHRVQKSNKRDEIKLSDQPKALPKRQGLRPRT
ncbi:hypothetical protein DE146DRAFT_626956 [Phaeosphaeria sp. MPI-PUGE-AT-0046c]|nr:hypothetical protein DE146DRAFT_626956 [Phaeosphaeria sp. MPI-PUGE-AT-0046c]